MAGRYLGGDRPAPRAASDSPLAAPWATTRAAYAKAIESCLLHEALVGLWAFVSAANKLVDAEQPWVLAKAAAAGDADADARVRGVLGDLVEAARLIGLAAAPFLPGTAPRVSEQLGFEYPYAGDGNGGPALLAELEWGRHAGEPGSLGSPVPLFPRLDVDSAPA
jgi:methionyl-tRNA synthetase